MAENRSLSSIANTTAVVVGILLSISPAARADVTWQVQGGDWSVASNWGASVPSGTDSAYIANGGTAEITLPGATCNNLYVSDSSSANTGNIQMTGGSLSVTNSEYVGNQGFGMFNQSDGTNMIEGFGNLNLGANTGGIGSYSLSGNGRLLAAYQFIGYSGTGAFMQSGGANSSTYTLNLGNGTAGSGNYVLRNGLLSVGQDEMLWNGGASFTQTGGTNTTSQLQVLGGATYTQSGGSTALANSLYVVGGSSNIATFNLAAGQLSTFYLYLGSGGIGLVNQSGGSIACNEMTLGQGTGSSGQFNQGGGYDQCNSLWLGNGLHFLKSGCRPLG